MRVVGGPHGELAKYVERLGRRLAREQRAANEDELRKLYRLLDQAEAWVPRDEGLFVGRPRPSREEIADEFGPEPAPQQADDKGPGRPGPTDEQERRVKELLSRNPMPSDHEIGEDVGISHQSVGRIAKKLGLR